MSLISFSKIALALLLLSPLKAAAQNSAVLLIGDGMGPTVITATRIHFKGLKGQLFLDQTKYRGDIKTYSNDAYTTDSAAAATAMATGVKVNNGVLGMSPPARPADSKSKGKKLKTIVDLAKQQGKSIAIITTTSIAHATPAAFYAHTNNRNNTEAILDDLKNSRIDIILGGGLGSLTKYHKGLKENYRLITKLKDLKCDLKQPLIGTFLGNHFPYIGASKNKKPRKGALMKMVKFAIKCLSQNKNGYFLVVEGGLIDKSLHDRNACNALYETREFDDVANYIVNHVDKTNTLVLATADHDTGGLAINGNILRTKKSFFTKKPCWNGKVNLAANGHEQYKFEVLRNSTDNLHPGFMHSNLRDKKKNFINSTHTAHDVDIFAWGKGAEKVFGLHDNTFVFALLKEALVK